VIQPHQSSLRGERGQALVEYAVIVAVIGACLAAILGLVGGATRRAYERTASTVSLQASRSYPAGGGGAVILTGGGPRRKDGPTNPPTDSTSEGGYPGRLDANRAARGDVEGVDR